MLFAQVVVINSPKERHQELILKMVGLFKKQHLNILVKIPLESFVLQMDRFFMFHIPTLTGFGLNNNTAARQLSKSAQVTTPWSE